MVIIWLIACNALLLVFLIEYIKISRDAFNGWESTLDQWHEDTQDWIKITKKLEEEINELQQSAKQNTR